MEAVEEHKKSSQEKQNEDINDQIKDDDHDIVPLDNDTIVQMPELMASDRTSADDVLTTIQRPAKGISRSPRTRSLANILVEEEKTSLPPPQDSLLSHLSTPSRISRSSTHQHLFTPEFDHPYYSSGLLPTASKFNFKKKKKSSKDLSKMTPSKRGIGNIVTILAVIAVILFLFAGYPLTIYITRNIHHSSE
ncbi:uncharacterized protein BX664DRAFT_331889 [Halteromyces radiatus]|uniref:uncharacterized protein n=1 Tax=Halteromyces radiatus TaxID=101107 RepID=UPI00221F85EF|nr:uncharacterized protein BX664DRAFT_331889 [Halteromyces radiatus]KAI8088976.1 hypothetical protein BX664DRAFT_331889 [Halteromyces radiatus]